MLESCQFTTIKMGVLIRRERDLQIAQLFLKERNSKDAFCFRLPTQQRTSMVTRGDLGWKINRSRGGVRP